MAPRALLGLLAALLSLGALAQAGPRQAGAQITVSVVLRPATGGGATPPISSGLCGSRSSGSVMAVGCADGKSAPVQVMAFTQRGGNAQTSSFDVYAGSGAILGWQVLSFDDRDYIEMTLGW